MIKIRNETLILEASRYSSDNMSISKVYGEITVDQKISNCKLFKISSKKCSLLKSFSIP